ncbi:hypothetical protein MTR67_027499 [Solanum verrucosum]|uniref:DUF4218 domain-containing protein n=1 Tax=Solanum verrucosum TaxID=315347 RepID=A0AAF0R9Q8_SOLVR|nr:hypothetical protein MTR67_027499 [Solanum verrucosum]
MVVHGKKSIFFELSYWATNKLRHNLDVMHIEKNICDTLLGTLLDILGKSKDHINSRYDLHDMGIRKELQLVKDYDIGNIHLAKACFSMKPEEKKLFCTVLKYAKLPKGFDSNISSRVQIEDMKVSGYKSHDAHFILHYLLQVAVRKVLPKNVSLVLIRLGNYFRAICSKVIRKSDLEKMKAEIIDIECELEKIFPPSLFNIMTHLPIHLVDEIKLGGPTHLRWMYSTERTSVTSRGLYQTEDDEDNQTDEGDVSPLFPKIGHPIGSMNKRKGKTFNMEHHEWFEAHRYALFNTGDEKVETFINTNDPFILASQVHQVFYVEDPIEKNVYYARNKVPVDLYDLEEKNCPNIEETFWRETNDDIGSSERVLDVDVRWSREDLHVDIIDLPSLAQHSENVTMETSEEEDDFDDIDWDWMEADD